jgi:hypothetical protein
MAHAVSRLAPCDHFKNLIIYRVDVGRRLRLCNPAHNLAAAEFLASLLLFRDRSRDNAMKRQGSTIVAMRRKFGTLSALGDYAPAQEAPSAP